MATKRIPPVPEDQLPELRRSSDITWGQWECYAGKDAGKLHYILIHASTNRLTQCAIRRACNMMGYDKPMSWPGYRVEFTPDSEIGKALLGTPNGRAVAYFLSQHRDTLGHKVVTHMDMFFMRSFHQPLEVCFLFYIQQAHRHDSTR
ncbi:hypothetical protein BKA66DRAFT_449998 [Pyrenochaeta sp. MPI-SDFR-AT-0127]|nr:hypothetical protein BKA66DRAFT_449998 [Pyrenochaeta sp. MPI-SDFR-AT-0127]